MRFSVTNRRRKIGRRNSNSKQKSGATLSMASPSSQNIAMAPPVQNPAPSQSPHNQYPPNATPPAQQQPTQQQQQQVNMWLLYRF